MSIYACCPEFILRELYKSESLKLQDGGISLALNNNFSPGTLFGFGLDVDHPSIPAEYLTLQIGDTSPITANQNTPDSPATLLVGEIYFV